MSPKIKNILIFVGIGGVLFGGYFFFMGREEAATSNLVSTPVSILPGTVPPVTTNSAPAMGGDFLAILLNVKNLKLDDKIFSDPAFQSLTDSSITLIQDGNEGRANPFAPLGSDLIAVIEENDDLTGISDLLPNTPPTQNIPSVPVGSVTAAEKEVYIAAILNRQKILSSGDVSKIKDYIKAMAKTPEDVKEIEALTNKEILESSMLMKVFSMTEVQLRSPAAVWTVTANEVKVSLKTSDNTTISSGLEKINGKWY